MRSRATTVVLSLIAAATFGAHAHAARVQSIEIRSDAYDLSSGKWTGWATYDVIPLRAVATWDDGVEDPGCTRSGREPKWETTYGWFDPPKTGVELLAMSVPEPADRKRSTSGASVVWSTGFNIEGRGRITVEYGGASASLSVHARKPTSVGEVKLPGAYYSEFVAPEGWDVGSDITAALLRFGGIRQKQRWGKATTVGWYLGLTDRQRHEQFESERARAREISRALSAFIRSWSVGSRTACDVPPGILGPGIHNYKTQWEVCRSEDVTPEEQWYCRPAMDIDFERLYFLAPDPHCTYMKLLFAAPFGSKLVIEGEFPRCRFFDLQVSPPYNPEFPIYSGQGNGEVPIVDADIEPLSGHTNPFRVGARRDATKRSYRVTFELAEGNAVALNEARNPGSMTEIGRPAYRATDSNNTRIGGAFRASGLWGGLRVVPAAVWMRYYAPDKGEGPLAGVGIPKAHLELPTGEKFWLRAKSLAIVARRQNMPVGTYPTASAEPRDAHGSTVGWKKGFGIVLGAWRGIARAITYRNPDGPLARIAKRNIRDLDFVLHGRGAHASAPGNLEASATCCNYINYMGRQMTCAEGKVVVLTGKLPRFPATRDGEAIMRRGEIRYFSITRYLMFHGDLMGPKRNQLYPLVCYGSLMDDEIETRNGWYAIVYSRPADRPGNAKRANGVTWEDWGLTSELGFTLRWLSVMPDWHAPAFSPDGNNMPWEKAEWTEDGFDPSLVSRNDRTGLLGDHHIRVHYMTKGEFEALGSRIDPREIPLGEGW